MEEGESPAACLSAQGSWSGSRLGWEGWTPNTSLGWWVYQQKVQWGAGCCAPTPREDLACTGTAERQHTAPLAHLAVWKFHGFLEKRAEAESIQPN